MFSLGNTQNASGGGAFGTAGQQQPGASSSNLFGSTSQPAAGGSTLFGSTTQQAPGTGGSIFGNAPAGSQTAGATGGGMFGTANTQTGGGLFGSTPAQQPSGGGLFGNTGTQPAAGNPFSVQSTAGTTAPAGTSLFGSASTNTPGSGSTGGGLFGNAATGGGLFGSTGGTSTTATGGGPFGSTGGMGATNAGRGLFGSTTGGSTTGTTGGLFGNAPGGTMTGATGGGLFGGSTTTPMNTGGSLFGSTTATQPNTGGGLFGTASNVPSNTGGGMFGSSTAAPFSSGTGGLFGGTTNAPSTAVTGGLFGGGTAAPTGSIFGGQAQAGLSAGQPSLFGSTVGQQQQPGMLFGSNLGQSTLLGVTQGNLFASRPALAPGQQQQDAQSQFLALTQRIEAIYHAWNPASPQCRFQHYFYNLVDPNHVHLYGRPSNATNDALWQKAVRENPDPSCLVPVIATGFDDLQTRVEAQSQQAAAHQERLKEIQTRIAALTQRHQLSNVSRLQRAAALQTQLTHRVLKVVQHLHLLIPSLRSSAIRPEEEALRAVLEDIDQEIRRPGGTGRMRGKLNELWALVGAVTAARERDRNAGGVEWAVVDDEGLSQIAQILSEEQAGLAHLTKVLQKDLKDLAVIQGTSIKEDSEYSSGSTSTLRSSSIY
ncbi:uncharacterized protein LAESUDRAFT_682065 [Laetiporus sulphureus 93-53]|uniref:Nucleoporin Nup54 alpha-helical domain-containing protein n=1 Tax=Laetiporus sulphureus 93-53 TaxID=1314785 RepID=A0A165DI59_9APHY|nr:uncharacterized protein LAESUDRAFT_682065 [Laetiporus sulphureus 93-53]KZT04934.1 hypothetical protein LAESUDRAFT_682065 [Laetiporus sulphureus 93-53]